MSTRRTVSQALSLAQFRFPSYSGSGPVFVWGVTGRMRSVTKGVHYIAFLACAHCNPEFQLGKCKKLLFSAVFAVSAVFAGWAGVHPGCMGRTPGPTERTSGAPEQPSVASCSLLLLADSQCAPLVAGRIAWCLQQTESPGACPKVTSTHRLSRKLSHKDSSQGQA